jgi:hypothetical protein
MYRFLALALMLPLLVSAQTQNTLTDAEKADGFQLLFDGKSLDGWKVNEAANKVARVEEGKIIAAGPRAHIFYVGDVSGGKFTNFEFRAKVFIHPGSNSGIYFHAKYQNKGWPLAQGYEAQVCSNNYRDPKKTGSVYGYKNLDKSAAPDGEWFDYSIKVQGNKIETIINGKSAATHTDSAAKPRLLGGTFALQCHDPKSIVEYHTIRVKVND